MMTVSKEILMHPDFITDLANELCETLEALIDAEFEKSDETDFDFIDECADAINAIRSGDEARLLPLISRKDFFKKLGIKTESKLRFAVAACAAIALLFAAGTQIETEENITVAQALSGIVSEFFENIVRKEEPTQPTTTEEKPLEEETAELIGISIDTTPEFKAEYYVGEEFTDKGIRVFGEFSNGERKLVNSRGLIFSVSETFGSEAGYETVIIRVEGFEESLKVRIIDSIETPKLTSVYLLFPDDFSFTSEDVEIFSLAGMRVFAVYSDKTERELSSEEYEVTVETVRTLFERYSLVTVSYGGCSSSFRIMKE